MDRNCDLEPIRNAEAVSLSARRAWIEIVKLFRQNYECFVALRKESVDRNRLGLSDHRDDVCRSPQGERG